MSKKKTLTPNSQTVVYININLYNLNLHNLYYFIMQYYVKVS